MSCYKFSVDFLNNTVIPPTLISGWCDWPLQHGITVKVDSISTLLLQGCYMVRTAAAWPRCPHSRWIGEVTLLVWIKANNSARLWAHLWLMFPIQCDYYKMHDSLNTENDNVQIWHCSLCWTEVSPCDAEWYVCNIETNTSFWGWSAAWEECCSRSSSPSQTQPAAVIGRWAPQTVMQSGWQPMRSRLCSQSSHLTS